MTSYSLNWVQRFQRWEFVRLRVVKVKGRRLVSLVSRVLQEGVGPVAVNPAFEDAWSSEEDWDAQGGHRGLSARGPAVLGDGAPIGNNA